MTTDGAAAGDTEPRRDGRTAPTLLVLAAGDDVFIATRDLEPGPHHVATGAVVTVLEPVALGHKVAARAVASGERIIRCGMPIGSATTAVAAGAWVHTHNLASDYIATFAHRGGER
jgi:altronate dehydratase small subunit